MHARRSPMGAGEENREHVQASSLTRERLTLVRQALPQVPAPHKIIQDPTDPTRAAQYIRLNYFSSDSTKQVMHVRLRASATLL